MAEVARSYKGKMAADWKFVYIAEAHAMDEWPIRSARFNRGRGPVLIEKQPREAKERCDLACQFANEFLFPFQDSCPHIQLLVDNPESGDIFEKEYAPWPLRLYLIEDGVMKWIAQPKDCSYDSAIGELMVILKLNDNELKGVVSK